MRIADIRRAGHVPTLVASLLHFEVSFMCWVLLGALGIAISDDLGLAPWAKGLAVGVPLVAGSLFRLIVGPLADRKGARPVGAATLVITVVAVLWGWLGARSVVELLLVGILLGVAGSSFAVALPLAGKAFEPRLRGLAMGIAGAGNSGTVVAALVAPRLAGHVGWHGVLGLASLPLLGVLVAFVALTRSSPAGEASSPQPLRSVWMSSDARSLCAIYLVTFGGFVGMVSFLPIFLRDAYGVGALWAATATAVCAGSGSLLRPFGGLIADKVGGERVLPAVFSIAAVALIVVAGGPSPVATVGLLTLAIGSLGAGNGAVFQIVPRRFPTQIGAVTGLVGAAGGLGGFLLPFGLGVTKSWTGSYVLGLAAVAVACLGGCAALIHATRRWRLVPVQVPA
ncbi:MAG TPA: MFS transporter [Actinomycetota bacterium]|jgi:NNP family nitrate/nitrite transporter-like MFS transporter|nr:MFS transporter [Actinomycetota bacterium]